MNNRKKWTLTAVILVTVCILTVGVAYARYQTELQNTLKFQTRNTLSVAQQQWQQLDGAYVLTFTMAQKSENSRIYLAASEGITAPENMQVILTLPGEDAVQLQATAEPIIENSILATVFGTGYVFRFLDTEGNELTFDMTTAEYTLTVAGLDSAAEHASLLRLFVEQAQ